MPRKGDGNVYIDFMPMGQGDCCIVTTPGGKVFIIDIGQAEYEPVPGKGLFFSPEEHLKSNVLFGTYKDCEALILTHSDRDHYNRVGILYDLKVKVKRVYHSDLITEYHRGTYYDTWRTGKSHLIVDLICGKRDDWSNIFGVTIADDAKKFTTRTGPKEDPFVSTTITNGNGLRQMSARGLKIHNEKNCQIYLLVSNLPAPATGSRATKRSKGAATNHWERANTDGVSKNRASIVTLIDVTGSLYLICGDAIGDTGQYVLDNYPNVKNLEILQAPHHGSSTNDSSAVDFRMRMNPRTVVVSAPRESRSQTLPRCEIISGYQMGKRLGTGTKRNIGCYEETTPPTKKRARTSRSEIEYSAKQINSEVLITGWYPQLRYSATP